MPDGRGGVLIYWTDAVAPEGGTLFLLRLDESGEPAAGWPAEGLALFDDATSRIGLDIVTDERGGAIVVWAESTERRALRILADGTVAPEWDPEGTLLTTRRSTGLVATSDDRGGLIVAFRDHEDEFILGDVWAQRVSPDGEVLWGTDGVVVSDANGIQDEIAIAADHLGGAWISWLDVRFGYPNYLIYASHVLASGAIDPEIPADGAYVDGSTSYRFEPLIVADPGADPIIAWEQYTSPGSSPRVYLTAFDASEAEPAGEVTARASAKARVKLESASSARVEFRAETSGATRVELFDVSGRRVGAHDLGWIPAGDRTASVALTRALAAGVYLVRISQADRAWTTRVALLK